MSEVSKAAAEYCRDILAAISKSEDEWGTTYSLTGSRTLGLKEPFELAAWALQLLDSEPVTEKWLESLGLKRLPCRYGIKQWRLHTEHGTVDAVLYPHPESTGLWAIEVSRLKFGHGDLKSESITRGAVRMLCLSLGITLTEPPQP